MVERIKSDPLFFDKYLAFFIERFVYATIEIEGYGKEEIKKSEEDNLHEIFCYLFNLDERINYFHIEEVGNRVNKAKGLKGFRKIHVLSGNDFTPIPPFEIRGAIYSLLDNYYNIWNILDTFEREARFCISLMRIHPFEDGNKRISKLILNSNFLKENIAPVIITEEDTDLFYEFINNQDYDGFAKFLRQRSSIEKNTMVGFLKTLDENIKK